MLGEVRKGHGREDLGGEAGVASGGKQDGRWASSIERISLDQA